MLALGKLKSSRGWEVTFTKGNETAHKHSWNSDQSFLQCNPDSSTSLRITLTLLKLDKFGQTFSMCAVSKKSVSFYQPRSGMVRRWVNFSRQLAFFPETTRTSQTSHFKQFGHFIWFKRFERLKKFNHFSIFLINATGHF